MKKQQAQLFRKLTLNKSDFSGFQNEKQSMLVYQGLIQWLGPDQQLKSIIKNFITEIKTKKNISLEIEEINLKNKYIFPAFIECHTHSVFSGSRADEFELRNQGFSYAEIAQKGGGILSTMKKTRQASSNELLSSALMRVNKFLEQGVATIEIKSGYGLDLKSEIKCLEVIQKLQKSFPKETAPLIVSTFLGAHAKPPEFKSYKDYLEYLVHNVLPEIKKKKLSNRVDIFIENHFFEKSESEIYLKAAQEMGFDLTIHANQLSNSGGAEVAQTLGAVSADHVIHLKDETLKKFKLPNAPVAVLLPMADLYMKCNYPPARKLIDAGACVALATDFNPGSCPSQDLSLVGLLARLEMKMTLSEVFKAYTINAAQALRLEKIEGSLEIGKKANFINTDAELTDFFYSAGAMPLHDLFIRGNKALG